MMIVVTLVLGVTGLTYAYFSLEIEGTGKDVIMSTADLRLIYKDDTELKLVDAMPGDSVSKVITVSNVGTKNATYSLYWGNLINTIQNFELHVTLECKSYKNYGESNQTESGTCDKIYRAVPISNTVTTGNIKKNISIEPGITQEYTVTIKFDNKNYSQDDNIKKTFTGKIGIEEYVAPEVVNCTFDGELTRGAEYVNGQYTYRYKQQGDYSSTTDLAWNNIVTDGWGVQLTDKASTDAVTDSVCTYINNVPVTSMAYMYYKSKTSSINLTNVNTSKVTSMRFMFTSTQVTSLDLSNFDTNKVTDMFGIFQETQIEALDLSNFDTSKVTNMTSMFYASKVKIVDLSNFNTEKVENMNSMFFGSKAEIIDLSNFDTSNVTSMSGMFRESYAKTLDLSSFDTSNVTAMSEMFSYSSAKILDLSNFDTSNVTIMAQMFRASKAITLNLSNFDTSRVKDMSFMFCDSAATEIKGLENFNTEKVENMSWMFDSTQVTSINVNSFDTSNVTDMSGMFSGSQAAILDVSNFNTSKVTNMSGMFRESYAEVLDLSNFDTSKVTNMTAMFYDSAATEIKGIENFNTSNVTNMSGMFSGSKAKSLDLSYFDTSNVTDMGFMFYNCNVLTTIYVGNKFTTDKVTSSSNMFYLDSKLVGGAGTVYDSSNIDKTYARVDGGTSSPGYFTLKSN